MKYYTMVMRQGNPKLSSNLMSYTLIADDLSITTMAGAKIMEALKTKKVTITNLSVENNELVSTNGSIKNYTTLDETGKLVSAPRGVILGRYETNGRLSGYQLFGPSGVVSNISVADAVTLAGKNMIANGKIRHTNDGDIVSSICGYYPLTDIKIDNEHAKVESVDISIVMFGGATDGKTTQKYAGFIVSAKDAKSIAKMYNYYKTENKELINSIKGKYEFTDEDLKGFEMHPVSGAGFYGVYPLETLKVTMEKFKQHTSEISNMIVGFRVDGSESIALLEKGGTKVVQHGNDDAAFDKYVKEVKEIITKYAA